MSDLPPPNFQRLAPKAGATILVIGGCGGIGHALVETSDHLGLTPIVMDLESAIERRNANSSHRHIPVDLREEGSIKTAVEILKGSHQGIDHVVITSGYTKGHDRIADMNTDQFDDVMSGNLRGPILMMRELAPILSPNASVVLISTAIGQVGSLGYGAYGAAKAGINAVTRILAAELAPKVRVNAVAPGAVDTAFIRGGYGEGASEDGAPARFDADAYNKMVPLGRMGHVDDITGPILFFTSEAARYITGQVLHVNGGAFMRD